tara:strand:+ start:2761 stop:3393 length:633 start_codon:yes stop_codon:yes gene_type:complete
MKISYAIPVCNEVKEIERLLNFLIENKREEDEIIILYDINNGDIKVEEYLRETSILNPSLFSWHKYEFDGHFANMKNHLTSLCNGDFIYQIDADELPTKHILESLWAVLNINKEVEVLKVPRINTVEGLTQKHIQKWGWRVNEKGWVNFPDYQWRIYKNNPKIFWVNKVHEVLTGFDTMSELPPLEEYCLLHDKTIERQEKQNQFYQKLK